MNNLVAESNRLKVQDLEASKSIDDEDQGILTYNNANTPLLNLMVRLMEQNRIVNDEDNLKAEWKKLHQIEQKEEEEEDQVMKKKKKKKVETQEQAIKPLHILLKEQEQQQEEEVEVEKQAAVEHKMNADELAASLAYQHQLFHQRLQEKKKLKN